MNAINGEDYPFQMCGQTSLTADHRVYARSPSYPMDSAMTLLQRGVESQMMAGKALGAGNTPEAIVARLR